MKSIATFICSVVVTLGAELPNADQIAARIMEQEQDRQAAVGTYSYTSTYVLQNKERHAEMVVRWTRHADGVKEYVVLSEQGDGGVRKHVFHRLLQAEVEASAPEQQAQTRITTSNYDFQLSSTEKVAGRDVFVIDIEPKSESKYLTRGRIWVDACDYAVVRVEGAPAHKVSFWTKNVNFVQTFEKNGQWWLPASNHSLTDARLFGLADLTIEYSDYQFVNPPAGSLLAAR
ncbi:MAG TPA: sigma-E factor regulatory protein RseB domain-containing protein [Bryobacteraceae bacterium]|nr:sigma-E factor regulatory protein RseB domain-containing protein [Bryobacteraceae bacterium]